jgi:hypothetical protein
MTHTTRRLTTGTRTNDLASLVDLLRESADIDNHLAHPRHLSQSEIDDSCVLTFRDYPGAVTNCGQGCQHPNFNTRLDYLIDRPELIAQAAYDLTSAYADHFEIDGDDETLRTDAADLERELHSAWNVRAGKR